MVAVVQTITQMDGYVNVTGEGLLANAQAQHAHLLSLAAIGLWLMAYGAGFLMVLSFKFFALSSALYAISAIGKIVAVPVFLMITRFKKLAISKTLSITEKRDDTALSLTFLKYCIVDLLKCGIIGSL